MYFFGAILFNIFITNTFELVGLQGCSPVKVSLIFCFAPFFGALLAYFLWHERLTYFKWLGLGLGLLGILLLYLPCGPGATLSTQGSDIWIWGAMIGTTVGWTCVKRLVFDYGYTPFFTNMVTMFIGGILSLIGSFLIEPWSTLPISDEFYFWILVGATALISCVVCYNLYAWLLRFYSVVFMTFAGFLCPFLTAIFGYFLLDETITFTFVGSFILLLLGLVIFYKEEIKKRTTLV